MVRAASLLDAQHLKRIEHGQTLNKQPYVGNRSTDFDGPNGHPLVLKFVVIIPWVDEGYVSTPLCLSVCL